MSKLQLRLGVKYVHIKLRVVFILTMADTERGWVELFNGTLEELYESNFRAVWVGTIDEFNEQWELK